MGVEYYKIKQILSIYGTFEHKPVCRNSTFIKTGCNCLIKGETLTLDGKTLLSDLKFLQKILCHEKKDKNRI